MGLLAPGFLAAAALLGLPLWLHLLKSHRATRMEFSSLMLFERHPMSSLRSRRLDFLLLLALRLALLALLVLAFAQPYVRKNLQAGEAGRGRLVVVVDESVSMGAQDRMAEAKQIALKLLQGIGTGRRAQVAALGSRLRILTEPTNDASELRGAVSGLSAGPARSSYGEFARAIRGLQQSARENLDVHLISDMQRSSLAGGFNELRMDPGTKLTLDRVGAGSPPNWCVESVTAPTSLDDPKKARVEAMLAGYHAEEATLKVSLEVNGKLLGSQQVKVPKDGRTRVAFTGLEAPYGWNRGAVRIETRDALAADNTYMFAVERADPRRILFLTGPRAQASVVYFRSALDSAAENRFVVEAWPADAPPSAISGNTSFVVLSDAGAMPAYFENLLAEFVRAGGSLWIALGPSAQGNGKAPVTGTKLTGSHYAARSGERFFTFGSGDEAHPSLQRSGRWDGVRFFQAVEFAPGEARIVARLNDRTPILAEQRVGEGRVLLFASTFDNVSNDFPLHPSFLPFVEQTARYLAGLEERSARYVVDDALELRQDAAGAATVEVFDPGGVRALSLGVAATARTVALEQSGYYEVRRGAGRRELVAVNVDRRESDLTPLPDESIALWQGPAEPMPAGGSSGAVEARVETRTFGWSFLWAALAAALAEGWLAARYLSRQGAR